MDKGITVLSLFDGMSCGRIALERVGIKVNQYFASEVDKYAMQVTQKNFPNTKQLGDVTKVNVTDLPKIDLLIGGSPCQSFSFAGKRKGMSTKCDIEIHNLETYLELKSEGFEFEGQSYLFWEYMRILTEIRVYNPNVIFLLENVEMGKKWERVLSQAIGVLGIHINSALVSAQNRKRIYWTNIYNQPTGLFGDMQCAIPQPEDKGVLLKDILETEVDEKYFLSDKMLTGLVSRKKEWVECFKPHDENEKCDTLTSRYYKMGKQDPYLKVDKKGNLKANQDKASCFTAGGNSGGNHSDMDCLIVAQRGRYDKELGKNTQQIEPRPDQKTNTITSVQKDNLVLTQLGYIGNANTQSHRVYDLTKSCCLQAGQGGLDVKTELYLTAPCRIRRLTPTECERLQTVPDGFTEGVSDTQRYRVLGNGWTVDVIAHIFSFMKFNNNG